MDYQDQIAALCDADYRKSHKGAEIASQTWPIDNVQFIGKVIAKEENNVGN